MDRSNRRELMGAVLATTALAACGTAPAGRALQKHGGKGEFPNAKGNISDVNAQGQEQLEDILTDPKGTTTSLGRGGTEVRLPDGRGARWESDGSFTGFVD